MIEKLTAMTLTKAAGMVAQSGHETLPYDAFPEEHSRRIRTNIPMARLMREIHRRVVGAFPDGTSCLNLAAAWLRHVAGTTWSSNRCLNMLLLTQQPGTQTA